VAIGGRLTPGALLGAYRRAIFCQPRNDPEQIRESESIYAPDVRAGDVPLLDGPGNPYSTLWWSPGTRYVLPSAGVHMSRSLRRAIQRSGWETTMDMAAERVIESCRLGRDPCWLTDGLVSALLALRNAGWIRSVEVWEDGDLIGGLFGCAFEHVFVMDSAFHLKPDAAKVAIADLARRASEAGIRLLDAQVRSDYTVQMGAVGIGRAEYLSQLGDGNKARGLATGPRSVRDLNQDPVSPSMRSASR
jgi:leucyl/phenylalanyl-tRNA--protein transferase